MTNKWEAIRAEFALTYELAHFAIMVVASNPKIVRRQIAADRRGLDREGWFYFKQVSGARRKEALDQLFRYFDVLVGLGTITHGTAVGLAQLFEGVRFAAGQEILTGRDEHHATVDALRFLARRDGTPWRHATLYREARTATADEVVANIGAELRPWTRVLSLTWVSSTTGVKLPIAEIAKLVAAENASRREEDRLLFIVDGVHGFGVENATFPNLGCDFFVAGCHKSLFGPRGTAIIAGKAEAWPHVVPITAPLSGASGLAAAHSPGGVRAMEHWWALGKAFQFQTDVLVKADVQARVGELVARFKAGLREMPLVTIVTPDSQDMSSHIVCFDVAGATASRVLDHLTNENIVASESSYDLDAASTHVRFSISVLNTEAEIDRALKTLAALTGA